MRYLILLFLFVGCGRSTATFEGKVIEYKEHAFGKQVDIYRGDRIVKKFKYLEKEKVRKKTELRTETTRDEYSCYYSGFCSYYSVSKGKYKHGFSSRCRGDRMEKRKYIYYNIDPTLIYKRGTHKLELQLKRYTSSTYTTLEIGKCG